MVKTHVVVKRSKKMIGIALNDQAHNISSEIYLDMLGGNKRVVFKGNYSTT